MLKLILPLLLTIAPVASALAQESAAQDQWDARVSAVSGDVAVIEAGKDLADAVPAVKDLPLQEGDRVRTGADSSADIAVDGASLIRLGAQTDFKLENTHRSSTLFGLSAGTFLAKIKKLLTAQTLQLRAPTAVAAVRGTEFGVVADADGKQSTVGVFDEGKVEVKGSAGTETLIADQETAVGADGKPASPYQLKELARHRAAVRGFKARLSKLAKSWKAMTPGRRAEARKSLLAKGREALEKRERERSKKHEDKRKESERAKREREEMDRARKKVERERRK